MAKETKLVPWGNSKATRIPQDVIKQLDLEHNQKLSIQVKDQSIILTPIQSRPQDIHELFKNWEDDGIRDEELDWGQNQGNELSW